MSKFESIMLYFYKDGEEDGTSYYFIKEGYLCLYNNELPITRIEIDDDGTARAGSDNLEPCTFNDYDWELISIQSLKPVLEAR